MAKGDIGKMVVDEQFVNILKQLLIFFKGNVMKTRAWLVYPNPNFGGIQPLKLMVMGKGKKVLEFIEDAKEEGQWTPREWVLSCDEGGWVVDGPTLGDDEKVVVRETTEGI